MAQYSDRSVQVAEATLRPCVRHGLLSCSYTITQQYILLSFALHTTSASFHLSQSFPTHHFSRRPDRSIPLTQGRKKVSERTPRRAALTRPFRPFELWQGLRNHTEYTVQNCVRNGQLSSSVSFDHSSTHGNPMSLS